MLPRRRPSRRDGAILPEERSAPSRQRGQVDSLENLCPAEQLDTFVDPRTKRTVRLKLCRQLVGGAVIRIEDRTTRPLGGAGHPQPPNDHLAALRLPPVRILDPHNPAADQISAVVEVK